MAKTSYRIPEEVLAALAELAGKCHNGNKTAALVAAVKQYHDQVYGEVVGWVAVRISGKARCFRCNNPIDGQGFTRLFRDGRLDGSPVCGKCAK